MSRAIHAVLLSLVLVTTAVAQTPEKAPADRAAATPIDRASCVLSIRDNSGMRRLEIQTVNATLTSTTFIDPIIAETFNLDAVTWPKLITIDLTPAGNNATKITVTVSSKAQLPPNSSRRLLAALTSKIVAAYAPETQSRDKLEALRKKLQTQMEAKQSEISEMRRKIDQLNSMRRTPHTQYEVPLEQLEADLAEKIQRFEILTSTFREVDESRKPLVEAARQLVKARAEYVTALEAEIATNKEVTPSAIAKARVDLAEAQRVLAQESRNSILDTQTAWFGQYIQSRLEIAGLKIRIERAMATSRPAVGDPAEEMSRLSREMQTAQMEYDMLRQEHDRTRQQLMTVGNGPELVVIGLEDAPK
jgi:predicted  nucleic acid-binding Zn-ribbon protein